MSNENSIKEIINLLEANTHPDLKKPFYFGDPLFVPASRLPTIAVDIENGESPQGATGHDQQRESLIIKVLVDKRVDLDKEPGQVVATENLIKYVEELDDTTGQYKDSTVLGILRKNLTLEKTSIGHDISWEYGVIERGEILIAECWVRIDVSKMIEIPSRA
jgi:hypothetical protein